uniref:Uncharacterized protein n=1 Tax=Ditylenchus dipsaci TaxID=166011 RepID=A0A915EB26_9BILA
MTYPVQDKTKVVWAAIGRRGVIGPFFFEENVTGISYLRLLQNQFYPAVRGAYTMKWKQPQSASANSTPNRILIVNAQGADGV